MAGMAAGGAAAGGLSGIFGSLSEIIDEVGDTIQALIAALANTYVIDRDVTTTAVHRTKVRYSNPAVYNTTTKVTTDHWKLSLLEVVIILLAAGVIVIVRNPNGKLGVALKKGITTAAFGPILAPYLPPLIGGEGKQFGPMGYPIAFFTEPLNLLNDLLNGTGTSEPQKATKQYLEPLS